MPMNAARRRDNIEARSRRCGTLSAGKARRRTPLGRVAFDDELALNHAPALAGSYPMIRSGASCCFRLGVRSMAHLTRFDEYTPRDHSNQPNRI